MRSPGCIRVFPALPETLAGPPKAGRCGPRHTTGEGTGDKTTGEGPGMSRKASSVQAVTSLLSSGSWTTRMRRSRFGQRHLEAEQEGTESIPRNFDPYCSGDLRQCHVQAYHDPTGLNACRLAFVFRLVKRLEYQASRFDADCVSAPILAASN